MVPCRAILCQTSITKFDKVIVVASERHIVDRVLAFETEVLDLGGDGLTEACEPKVRTISHFDNETGSREHHRGGGFRPEIGEHLGVANIPAELRAIRLGASHASLRKLMLERVSVHVVSAV